MRARRSSRCPLPSWATRKATPIHACCTPPCPSSTRTGSTSSNRTRSWCGIFPTGDPARSKRKKLRQRNVGFHDRRFQHDEGEVLVDADIEVDQALHDFLVLRDTAGDAFQEIVVSAGYQVTLNDRFDLFNNRQKACEIDLAMVLQSDLRKDGQRLAKLGHVDLGGVAKNVTRRLQLLHPHQARAGRQMHQFGQFDIGDPAVALQFIENPDVDPVEFHVLSSTAAKPLSAHIRLKQGRSKRVAGRRFPSQPPWISRRPHKMPSWRKLQPCISSGLGRMAFQSRGPPCPHPCCISTPARPCRTRRMSSSSAAGS